MRFGFCKEQQHSKKTEFFRDYGVAEAPPFFKPTGLIACIFLFWVLLECLIWN
jgi:hypothetical protein